MWIRKMILGFLFMLMSIGLYTLILGIFQLFHIQFNDPRAVFTVAFAGFVVGVFSRVDKYCQKKNNLL